MMNIDSSRVLAGLLAATLAVTLLNTALILSRPAPTATGGGGGGGGGGGAAAEFALPSGTPAYAEDLGVTFAAVSEETPREAQETIRTLAQEDSRQLSDSERDRLATVLHDMHGGLSCEYCCEAESVVTADGEAACGCSHAVAMRGLAKHLVQETDMSDDEIFREVSRWKVRFFPSQSREKFDALQSQDVRPTTVKLASNEYRGAASGGGWVGDC